MKTQILTIALIIMINLLHLMTLTACAQAQGNKLQVAKTNTGKEQTGNVLFTSPANWQRLDNNGQTIFIAPNSNESTVITLLPSEQLYGSLKTWFANFINKNHSEGKIISGGQIVEGSSDEGYPVYLSELAYQANDGSISYRFYVAAHPDKQAHIIALISTDLDQYNQHKQTFDKFVQSVDFAKISYGKTNNSSSTSDTESPPTKVGGFGKVD